MPAPRFAVVLSVGPSSVDLCRGLALLASLVLWEPGVGWCVVVEDAPHERGLSEVALIPETCEAITLLNPRRGRGYSWSGGVCTGILIAFAWVKANTDADFVLILETDALVIGAFAEGIRSCLRRAPDAGMFGTIGWTCNERVLQHFRREPALVSARRLLPPAPSDKEGLSAEPLWLDKVGRFSLDQRRAFDIVRPHIAAAVEQGYDTSEFCQGGAVVVSREMVDRMAAAGHLMHPEVWMHLPFPGDQILQMYARAVRLRLCACTHPGEPFAVQSRGLPYALEELVARGHSLIHSIKNDRRYTEAEIREFFGKRATTAPGRRHIPALV